MEDLEIMNPNEECHAPWLAAARGKFCFGESSEEERARFESHLLECDFCWQEIQRLDAAIDLLRRDKTFTDSELARSVLDSVCISAKLENRFGGHTWHVLLISGLYASLYAVALALEVAYEFDSYRNLALFGAPLVFFGMFIATLWGLQMMHSQILRGRHNGLLWASLIFLVASITCYLVASRFLPDRAITQAAFQTYTARAAYLKDTITFLPLAAIFLLLPYSFVLSMQRELKEGRYSMVSRLLSGDKQAVPPRFTIYLKVRTLGILFGVIIITALIMIAHLLDNLKAVSSYNLFQTLVWFRFALFFLLGAEGVVWYYLVLNDLKREARVRQELHRNH